MAAPIDPYRTLGLAPGASADEIRRAYRRLAKANHPDSAGEAALPRFLAIQAAYEMLVAGRTRRASAGRAGTRGTSPPTEPWRADPARARATRDGSARRRGTGKDASGGPGPGGTGPGPGPSGPGTAPGGTGPGPRTGGSSERSRRTGGRSRAPNKATLGSTSYDAAEDEPFEPEWSGGTWYGSSSGTYWTLNPKEYADPRKHGPEYQRRARRRIDGIDEAMPGPADEEGPSIAGEDFSGPDTETAAGPATRAGFDGRWAYPDDGPADAGGSEPPPAAPWTATATTGSEPIGDVWARLSTVGDRLLRGQVGGLGRIALAVVGWFPIGATIAWLSGELSGCGRFSASCDESLQIGSLLVQLVALIVFVALPQLAAISAAGAITALAASVPAAFVLSATGGSRQPAASSLALSVVFIVGYVAGAAFATGRRRNWRRVP